jgi:predicted nucleic acid-binding protein
MRRTYIDAGVLTTAARGNASLSEPAIDILCDAGREFVSSALVRLEVLPRAQSSSEIEFYETYFKQVAIWAPIDPYLLNTAAEEARLTGVTPLNAIHLALAASTACDELVTTEKAGSAMFGSKRVSVVKLG